MLIEASRLMRFPVLSLQTSAPIGNTEKEIIDPGTLKLVAFKVWGAAIANDVEAGELLETRDVREFSTLGMIIDSVDVLVNPGDVVKLDKVLELNFSLIGLKVVTKKKSRLGKVIDFIIDTDSWMVKQLIVKRPIVKSLVDPELVIPRNEVVEITDYEIIVKDEEEKIKSRAMKEDFVPNFVNPFREPDFSGVKIEHKENKNYSSKKLSGSEK